MATLWNPPFHPHMLSSPPHTQTQNLARGYILEDSTSGARIPGHQHGVRFMYNPAAISLTHGINSDSSPLPTGLQDPNNRGQVLGASQNSLSFSLLFDRTYDVWDSNMANTQQGKFGVFTDVSAIYALVGLLDNTNSDITQSVAFAQDIQYMVPVPAFFYFGAQGQSLNYYGFISSLSVNYTSWTAKMTPKRCEVDIGVTLWINQTGVVLGAPAPTGIQRKAMQY